MSTRLNKRDDFNESWRLHSGWDTPDGADSDDYEYDEENERLANVNDPDDVIYAEERDDERDETCGRCRGTGEEECSYCGGSGMVDYADDSGPNYCPKCDDDGIQVCSACDGSAKSSF